LQALTLLRLPESPRWLLSRRGDVAAARDALKRLRGASDVEQELGELTAGLARERGAAAAGGGAAAFSMGRLFRVPALRRTLLVCSTLQICQQLSGINAIVYFTPQAGHSK
jgi:hypothetical protein